jgi:hypothetical protein
MDRDRLSETPATSPPHSAVITVERRQDASLLSPLNFGFEQNAEMVTSDSIFSVYLTTSSQLHWLYNVEWRVTVSKGLGSRESGLK